MESRINQTLERHKKGYNCAQAVACTYCDLVGINEKTMFMLSEGLGLGIGCTKGTCGALTGAVLLAGMSNSSGNLASPDSKASTYSLSKEIMLRFEKSNGSTICSELKGIASGTPLRSCDGCIEDAVRLVEELLFSDN